MEGRAYDYNLGRFYGVDPVIQFPTNSQSLNGYSYLMNNPLSGTDPTGYCQAPTGTRICSGERNPLINKIADTLAAGGSVVFKGLDAKETAQVQAFGASNGFSVTLGSSQRSQTDGAKGGASRINTNARSNSTDDTADRQDLPDVLGSGTGMNSSKIRDNDFEAMARAEAVQVSTMYSNPGESLPDFRERIHGVIQKLTSKDHFEYTSNISRKFSNNAEEFGTIVNTSHSPVVSVAVHNLDSNGWKQLKGENIHSHGIFVIRYKITRLDNAYLRAYGFDFAFAGMKVDFNNIKHLKNFSAKTTLSTPSEQDNKSEPGGWLSSPFGLVRYDKK